MLLRAQANQAYTWTAMLWAHTESMTSYCNSSNGMFLHPLVGWWRKILAFWPETGCLIAPAIAQVALRT